MDDQHGLIGHNSGAVAPYDEAKFLELKGRVSALAETGGTWLDLGAIDTKERAQKAVDFTAQVKKAVKYIEDERKAAKQPHMDAAKAVDDAYKALSAPLTKLADRLSALMTAYQLEQQRIRDEERRQQEAEARRVAEEARRAAEEAARRNDVIGEAAAEEAAAAAEKAAKAAAKPQVVRLESATGGASTVAMRTYYTAHFDPDMPEDVARTKAFVVLSKNPEHRAKLDALLLRLAEAERRNKDGADQIAGITFTTEQKAV